MDAPLTTSDKRDPRLVDMVLADHADVKVLHHKFQIAAKQGEQAAMVQLSNALCVIIRLHSQAEMDVLYPGATQELGGQGASLTKRSLAEHAEVETLCEQMLKQAQGGGSGLQDTVEKCCQTFFDHAADEENEMLPLMATALSEEQQLSMVKRVVQSKMNAPLKPQTSVREV